MPININGMIGSSFNVVHFIFYRILIIIFGHTIQFVIRIIPGDEISRHFPAPTRPTIYKSRSASPTPKVSVARYEAPDRSAVNEDLSSSLSAIRGKLNPVKELQMLGRQNSTNDEVNATLHQYTE